MQAMKYHTNTPELAVRRRALRNGQTEAERKLWAVLKGRKLNGYKIRRQFSVGPYILDFYCFENKICIELDGGQHQENEQYDNERTKYLNSFGVTVLRFWNNDVIKNTEGVYRELAKYFNEPAKNSARIRTPSYLPLKGGEEKR